MVSGDTPEWFVGLRTVPGPFDCKAVPVRRCPKNYIDGKVLRVRAQTYEQGDCMDVTDRMQDTSRLPTPERRPKLVEPEWRKDLKLAQAHQINGRAAGRPGMLTGGGTGCIVPARPIIAANMVTRERFEPGCPKAAGRSTKSER